MNMKQLYALLIILIVLYIGINVGANGLNILNADSNSTTDSTAGAVAGNITFPKLDGFIQSKVSDSEVQYLDNSTGVTIDVQTIDNSKNITEIYNSLLKDGSYTSSQEVDQNGVTTYYLYKEGQTGYSTDIYFNKNGQNFKINVNNITYEDSDFFIKNCKNIIDSISGGQSSSDGKISRF